MNLNSRISNLEKGRDDDSGRDLWSARWNEAYCRIAETMDAEEFPEVHAEIIEFLESVNNGGVSYWSSDSTMPFVSSRVLSIVHRAANGFQVGLLMPPELSAAWREHDRRHADSSQDERFNASFNSQTCVDCGAEHPALSRYERRHSEAQGWHLVLVNDDEVIKTCLVCGGTLGHWNSYKGTEASSAVH